MENIENTEKKEIPVASFEYDVKNEEEEQAFRLFQKRFVYKKNWIKTVAFSVVAVLFLVSAWRSPDQPLNYILAAVCVAAIFITWYNTKKIRESLVNALKMIEDDKYVFTLYENKFKIETVWEEIQDEDGEIIPPPQPRVVDFADISLKIFETSDKFVLVLKKDTIYVLPKRCMTGEQAETLKKVFSEKLNEDFEKIDA